MAFELNLDEMGDNTLGAPKRMPKRLRRLDPIAALPKISMTQLQDQQEAANLKRKRVCARRHNCKYRVVTLRDVLQVVISFVFIAHLIVTCTSR